MTNCELQFRTVFGADIYYQNLTKTLSGTTATIHRSGCWVSFSGPMKRAGVAREAERLIRIGQVSYAFVWW